MKLGELFVDLGFDVDDQKLKDFNDKIVTARNDILKMSAVATGGVYALNAFMERSGQSAVQLRNMTTELNASTDAVQRWQTVVHRTNPAVSLEQAQGQYRAFLENIAAIKRGQGDAGALAMLGVKDVYANPEQILNQIAQNLNNGLFAGHPEQISALLERTGLGAGSRKALDLLGQHPDQYLSLGNTGVVSPEDLARLAEFQEQMAKIDVEWRKFTMDLASQMAPQIVQAIDDISAAMKKWIPVINETADALGGWKRIGEAILAYFTLSWSVRMLAAIGRVGAALTLGEVGAAAAAGTGAVLAGGATAAAVIAPAVPWATNKFLKWKGEDGIEKGWAEHLADTLYPTGPYKTSVFKSLMGSQTLDDPRIEHLMPSPADSGGSTGTQVSVTNQITQHINTTADAKDTANEAVKLIQKQNTDTYIQLNLGPSH